MMDRDIWRRVEQIQPHVVTDWHWLHQHPEVSFQEVETARYIAARLREMGLAPHEGIGGHGIKVVLTGKRPGPTIALRADMDALPIAEDTSLLFASCNPGVMHACGHDAHVAMMLGAVRGLTCLDGDFAGTVVFLFQPAEEANLGGANLMVQAGVLDTPHVEAIFALHINPLADSGTLEFAQGPIMAAPDELTIVVNGRRGHGAYPHLTADAVLAAADIVVALQHVVSRNVPPLEPAVITVGKIHGGTAPNVIANQVSLSGTIRTMNPALRDQMPLWIERVAQGVAAAHDCTAEVKVERGSPPVVNNPVMSHLARQAAARVLPPTQIARLAPSMGGEDFSYFLEKVPGCLARIGVAPAHGVRYPLHSEKLRIDEQALATGVAFWLALVKACESGLPAALAEQKGQ